MGMLRLWLSLIGGVLLISSVPLSRASEIVDGAYVDEATKRGAIVWDVRDAKAYAVGHIPGARNVAYERNWVDPETVKKLKS